MILTKTFFTLTLCPPVDQVQYVRERPVPAEDQALWLLNLPVPQHAVARGRAGARQALRQDLGESLVSDGTPLRGSIAGT